MKAIQRRAREAAVEAELVRQIGLRGGRCEKVQLVGRRGFPDRLCLLPGGLMLLVELKRPRGGRLSVHQIRYSASLSMLDVPIEVVRNTDDIVRLVSRIDAALDGGFRHPLSE